MNESFLKLGGDYHSMEANSLWCSLEKDRINL